MDGLIICQIHKQMHNLYSPSSIFFFFLRERERDSFNLWCLLLMIVLYHQTKIPIDFWCRQGLNPKSFIQLSETLLVELTRTHNFHQYESILLYYFCNDNLARSPDWCTNRVSHLCAQCTLEAFYIRLVTVH